MNKEIDGQFDDLLQALRDGVQDVAVKVLGAPHNAGSLQLQVLKKVCYAALCRNLGR